MRRSVPLAGSVSVLAVLAVAATGAAAPVTSTPTVESGSVFSRAPEPVTLDPLGDVDDFSRPVGSNNEEDLATALLAPDAGGGGGGHVVTVRVAADEEWRNQLGGKWKDVANTVVENADDRMWEVFGIDLRVKEYVGYNSVDGTGDACKLLGDLQDKVGTNGKDIVLGFLGQGKQGGCAYLDGRYAVTLRSSKYQEWKVARHEISHLFNALDRYFKVAGDNPNHEDDVMEDPYDHPNRWVSPDRGRIWDRRAKFD